MKSVLVTIFQTTRICGKMYRRLRTELSRSIGNKWQGKTFSHWFSNYQYCLVLCCAWSPNSTLFIMSGVWVTEVSEQSYNHEGNIWCGFFCQSYQLGTFILVHGLRNLPQLPKWCPRAHIHTHTRRDTPILLSYFHLRFLKTSDQSRLPSLGESLFYDDQSPVFQSCSDIKQAD